MILWVLYLLVALFLFLVFVYTLTHSDEIDNEGGRGLTEMSQVPGMKPIMIGWVFMIAVAWPVTVPWWLLGKLFKRS